VIGRLKQENWNRSKPVLRQASFRDETYETAYEVFYGCQVFGWLTLKPDLQYIVNPGGTARNNTTVIGLRAVVLF